MNEPHLTNAHSDRIDILRKQTVPGMAHWAGTGPEGMKCLGCANARFHGFYAARGAKKGLLKPITCAKYKDMMGHAPSFSGDQSACRFFVEGDGPPKRP